MSAFEGMVVLMFLAKTSGFVLKEPGAVFAEGQSSDRANLSEIQRPLGSA